jgi:bacteriocin-like protein
MSFFSKPTSEPAQQRSPLQGEDFSELSDEELEQVSGGRSPWTKITRAMTDISTLGLAEIGWHTKGGKDYLNSDGSIPL